MDLNPRRCRLSRSLEKPIGTDAPPVLFGCGNKALLQAEVWRLLAREMLRLTICAIPNNGSETGPTGDLRYLWWCARYYECAMASALEAGGTAVGVLAIAC